MGITLSPVAGTSTLQVGTTTVLWLPSEASVRPEDIETLLTKEEKSYAASIRSISRRFEYERTRWLIRRATSFPGPLPRSPEGAPSWPPGLVGSITHKQGHVAIALAEKTAIRSVGIDAENPERMQLPFEERILTFAERRLLDSLAPSDEERLEWLTTIFSFKEALFKCHFPLGGLMFYFHDAAVTRLDSTTGSIEGMLLVDTSPETPAGHQVRGLFYNHQSGGARFILTAVTEPPAGDGKSDVF